MENNEVEVIDTSKKLRVGIIGCGGIAKSHVNAYLEMPDVEIVAGCDLVPGKAPLLCGITVFRARKLITRIIAK